MEVKRLATVKMEGQDCPYGIVAETSTGQRIIVAAGFRSAESATANIGAMLGRYVRLFFYDNEYPIVGKPKSYSLRGANATWNDTEVWHTRTYWIQPSFEILHWHSHQNIFVD